MTNTEIIQLRIRARAGDAAAMTTLGRRLLTGDGVAPAPEEGVKYITDAAAKGNGEAIAQLAGFAAWGVMRQIDIEEALNLLARSAKSGYKPAQQELRFLARQERCDDWRGLRSQIDVAELRTSPVARVVSQQPRIAVFEKFARPEECDWIVARSGDNLQRAQVYRRDAPGLKISEDRTNSEADLTMKRADIVLSLIRDRIAAAVQMPVSHFEVTKLLHYEPGQEFHQHSDFITADTPPLIQDVQMFGQRIATFLVYLNDDYEGGETDFPKVKVRFKGRKGDALLFYNLLPSGQPDYATLHAGLPPASGVKWLLSQWIRTKPINQALR